MKWFSRLQEKWGVSAKQLVIILLVFACTGTTIYFLKKPVVAFFTGGGEKSTLFSVIYFILIFPIYIVFLMFYGWIFGQYEFFKAFAKKSLSRFRKKSS